MASRGVVVGFDPVECLLLQVFDVRPGAGVDEFFLVGGEERLGDGVVVADPGPAQRPPYPVLPAVPVELFGRVLGAAVGTKPNSA